MATVQQIAPRPVIPQVQINCCCNPTGDVTQSKQTMRGVAIAETVLGAFIFLFGAILTAIGSPGSSTLYGLYSSSYNGYNLGNSYNYRYNDPFNVGEGIWCGLLIIVAGVTGIVAAKPDSTQCMIRAHMGLSIIAAVMSVPLFSLAVISALYPTERIIVLNSLNSIFALACLGMHIRSAHLCCLCIPGCCGVSDPQPFTQVVYATQQPGVLQSAGPGYVVQGHPPQVQGQGVVPAQQLAGPFQSTQINPGCVQQAIPQNQGYTAQAPEQVVTTPQSLGQEKRLEAGEQQSVGSPPAYSNP